MNKQIIKDYKKGDWVRIVSENTIYQIKSVNSEDLFAQITLTNKKGFSVFKKDLIFWEPKRDEWCWFWNNIEDIPILRQFSKNVINYIYNFKTLENEYYKYCEPFIGTLPTILKEK